MKNQILENYKMIDLDHPDHPECYIKFCEKKAELEFINKDEHPAIVCKYVAELPYRYGNGWRFPRVVIQWEGGFTEEDYFCK